MTDRTTTTAAAIGAGAVGLAVVALALRPRDVTAHRARASKTVTIRRDPEALYALWRDPANLPLFFRGVRAAEATGERAQRWLFDLRGKPTPLDVEVVDDSPPTRFEWRVHRRGFDAQGSLTLLPAPADRGTQARFALAVTGAAAKTGAAMARVFGASPPQIAAESLRAFKALAEAGEVPKAVRN